MKRTFFLKKLTVSLITLMLIFHSVIAHATDVPIDPGTITGQRDPQQEAFTARRGVDLFSDTSDEITERLERQREEKLAAAQETLFIEPFYPHVYDPETLIQQAVSEARLFNAPMRFDWSAQHEIDDSGIPLWIIIIVLAAAFALGLFIAIKTSSRRKERAS